jgi:hypothetical protein
VLKEHLYDGIPVIAEFWLLAGGAIACQVMLVALVPRRWLGWTMLAWAFFPLITYVGIVAWEGMTRPGAENVFHNALLGLSLISAIFIIPWGVACAIGFAVGLGLRSLIRRTRAATAPHHTDIASPTHPAAEAPPQTSKAVFSTRATDDSSDAAEWRQVHIGFENDGLEIGGWEVWKHSWRGVKTAPLRLAHPAYPDQVHSFTVHEIGEGPSAARFAASDLSNGVWGFYVPRQYPGDTTALSADGSLRYGQRNGDTSPGRPGSPASWAVLIDTVTERVLVDCAAWPESKIAGNADGSLLLRLRQDACETLFRIDPLAGTFRNPEEHGPGRPLLELADIVEQLRRACAELPRGPHDRRISPDGTIRIDILWAEWGNSHWVQTPRVIDIASGQVVLDLWNTDWDATISWTGDRRVSLDFRRYHFSGDLAIELDLENRTYRITREPGGGAGLPSGPLEDAANAMEASGRRIAAFAAQQGGSRPVRDAGITPNPFAAWPTAVVILLVAAFLILVATLLSTVGGPKPAREPGLLRSIPKPQLSSPKASSAVSTSNGGHG